MNFQDEKIIRNMINLLKNQPDENILEFLMNQNLDYFQQNEMDKEVLENILQQL